jgi:hypothetical protein
MSWNLFQYVSYELSHSLQHLFLVYDEEKNDFKGKWVISFELKNRVCCQLSQLDLASGEEEYFSLGRLSTYHQQSTRRKIRDLPLFEEIFLVSCKQFSLSIFSRSDPCF